MTYEVYRNIFLVAAIAAAVMVTISILLFFWLKIPSVIGELTGATARKGIEAIRMGNETGGNEKNGMDQGNRQRAQPITVRMTPNEAAVLPQSKETMVLPQINETTVLLQPDETTVLPQSNESMVWLQQEGIAFEVLQDITIIHTDEMTEGRA